MTSFTYSRATTEVLTGDISTYVSRLTEYIEQLGTDARSKVLGSVWEGETGEAFGEVCASLENNLTDIRTVLEGIGNGVQNAFDRAWAGEKRGAARFGR